MGWQGWPANSRSHSVFFMKRRLEIRVEQFHRAGEATVVLLHSLWFACVILINYECLQAQSGSNMIRIQNNSFEGEPSCCKVPEGWLNDADSQETPPDLLPALNDAHKGYFLHEFVFNVQKKPMNGRTYLAMAVRQHGTYERVKQKIVTPLEKDSCYAFSIYLSYADNWLSGTIIHPNNQEQSFGKGCILRVWGYGEDQKELLATGPVIEHLDWFAYQFSFRPSIHIQWIALEAYYAGNEKYNGNILLDGMSNISKINCPQQVMKPD